MFCRPLLGLYVSTLAIVNYYVCALGSMDPRVKAEVKIIIIIIILRPLAQSRRLKIKQLWLGF